MQFDLDFNNSIILSCSFFFFLIVDLSLLIPIGITIKEEKSEIVIHQVILEAKIRKCLI